MCPFQALADEATGSVRSRPAAGAGPGRAAAVHVPTFTTFTDKGLEFEVLAPEMLSVMVAGRGAGGAPKRGGQKKQEPGRHTARAVSRHRCVFVESFALCPSSPAAAALNKNRSHQQAPRLSALCPVAFMNLRRTSSSPAASSLRC